MKLFLSGTLALVALIAITIWGGMNGLHLNNGSEQAQVIAATTNGLVGYWNLNEGGGTTATDSSGVGNTATLINGVAWSAGKIGSGAVLLNGTNQYLDAGNGTALQLSSQMTYTFWANESALSGSAAMAGKWSGVQESWLIRAVNNTIKVNIAPTLNDLYTTFASTAAGSWGAGTWHHVAVVYNGAGSGNSGKLAVYIDGVLQSLTFGGTIPSRLLNASSPLAIGSGNGWWNGAMDEVRIYNRALTSQEISDIYNDGGTVVASPPPTPTPTPTPSPTPTPTPPPQSFGQAIGGSYVDTLLRAVNNNDFYFGGTVSPFAWPVSKNYSSLDFVAALDFSPGAGTWNMRLEYGTLAPSQICDDITAWNSVNLCTITGSNKSCTANAVPVNIVAPACVRGHATLVGSNNSYILSTGATAATPGLASIHFSGSPTLHFQGSGGSSFNTNFFVGNVVRATNEDRAFWISPGVSLTNSGGVIALTNAPGAGTWHVKIASSQTALTTGQNCMDLTYNVGSDVCTISGSNKSCSWSSTPVNVPVGGCTQVRATCTGGTCTTSTSGYFGVDFTPASSAITYETAGSGAFNANHIFGLGPWAISDALPINGAPTLGQQYWVAPGTGLNSCAGAFTFASPIGGTGQYNIGVRVSNASLTPGKGCLDLSYADTGTFCSIAAGSKSCNFPMASVSVPANGCFALNVKSSGAPSAGTSPFNWQANCTAGVSPTPTPVPPPPVPPPVVPPPPPLDAIPPVISSLTSSSITSTGATISWVTDEVSDTQVEYGLTSAYGASTALNSSLVTSHFVILSNLSAATVYHYRVKSKDGLGNLAISTDRTFTTSAVVVPPPPPVTGSNTITITEKTGSSQTGYPVQIGRPFIQGEIPSGQLPQAFLGGVGLPTQVDVKQRWGDGSLRHAVISFIIPTLNANQTVTIAFAPGVTVGNTPLSQSQMLANNFDFDAGLNTSVGNTSARTMLSNGDYTYWTSGPIATTILLADDRNQLSCNGHACSKYDFGADANKSVRPRFYATFWPNIDKVQVRFVSEIANTESLQDQNYSVALTVGNSAPTQVYSKGTFTQSSNTRWTKVFWLGGTPTTVATNHNIGYLAATTLIPNYDSSISIPSSTLTNWCNIWNGRAKDIGDAGVWEKNMPTSGGRADIGPYPDWIVNYLYTGDPCIKNIAFGSADLEGSWPVHYREGKAGKNILRTDAAGAGTGMGHIGTVTGRPTTYAGTNFGTNAQDMINPVGTKTNQGWVWDTAHEPEAGTPLYLVSGDYYYLEEAWFWAGMDSWSAIGPLSPYARRGPTGAEGVWNDGQVRAMAWNLRTMANTAAVSPDSSPEKTYFNTLINDATAVEEGAHKITSTAFNGNVSWNWGKSYSLNTMVGYPYPATGNIARGAIPPLHQFNNGGAQFAQNEYGMCSTYGAVQPAPSPCDTNPTVTQASSLFEYDYLLFALGRAKELGYPTGALVSWLGSLYTGMLTDPGFNPYMIDNGRVPTVDTSGNYFTTFAQLKDGYVPAWKSRTSLSTWGSGDGYAAYASGAISYLTGEPNGQAAWNFMQQHFLAGNPNVAANPKWAILPRVQGVVTPGPTPSPTPTPTPVPPPVVPPTPVPPPSPSTTFVPGDRVQTTAVLNVRGSASSVGTLLGSQILGALGTVVSGGVFADTYYWWNVNYDNGVDGWSVENFLRKYTVTPTPAPPPVVPPTPSPTPTPTPTPPPPALPIISSFTATPNTVIAGQPVTLSWVVSGATSLNINQGVGLVIGNSKQISPSQTNQYTLTATNSTGSVSLSTIIIVTPAPPVGDITPPVISGVLPIKLGWSAAQINWVTNENSTSQVEYGLTPSYGLSSPVNTNLTTLNTMMLGRLQPGVTYHYRVKSGDVAGNIGISGDFTFATQPRLAKPPRPSILTASPGSVTLGWSSIDYDLCGGIKIYRSTTDFVLTATAGGELVNLTCDETSYHDTAVVDGTRYYYSLFVYDDQNIYSDPATVSYVAQAATAPGSGSSSGSSSGRNTSVTSVTAPSPTAPTTLSIQRTLSVGLKGSDVSSLQSFLSGQGYLTPDNITGYFGPVTQTAVQKFQKAQGIVYSGSPKTTGYGAVGPKTLARMKQMLGIAGAVTATINTDQIKNQIMLLQYQVLILTQQLKNIH